MSTIDILESTGASSAEYLSSLRNQTTSTGGLTIDTETFLKLLVAQLQYQDPLEPQTDTDFVAQLAQMSQLEYMQNLYNAYASSQAVSYIGKFVIGTTTVSGQQYEFSGVVDSVVMKSGKQYVLIGDYSYLASEVTQVFDSSILGSMNDAMNLIGKYITGYAYEKDENGDYVTDENGEYQKVEVSGYVTGAERSDTGLVYVVVDDGSKVAMSDISKAYTEKPDDDNE